MRFVTYLVRSTQYAHKTLYVAMTLKNNNKVKFLTKLILIVSKKVLNKF